MSGNILGPLSESKCEIDTIKSASSGTDFIYNAGTKIEAQTKVDGAGPDSVNVWFKIQEI